MSSGSSRQSITPFRGFGSRRISRTSATSRWMPGLTAQRLNPISEPSSTSGPPRVSRAKAVREFAPRERPAPPCPACSSGCGQCHLAACCSRRCERRARCGGPTGRHPESDVRSGGSSSNARCTTRPGSREASGRSRRPSQSQAERGPRARHRAERHAGRRRRRLRCRRPVQRLRRFVERDERTRIDTGTPRARRHGTADELSQKADPRSCITARPAFIRLRHGKQDRHQRVFYRRLRCSDRLVEAS